MQTFHIFGLSIHFLGLMTAIGFLVGYGFAHKEIIRKKLNSETLEHLAVITVLSGLIGARLFYVVFYNLNFYLEAPLRIVRIYDGGLSIHGGLSFAFVAAFIYIRIKRLNFLAYADAIAPPIILAQAIGRVGCDVFGIAMQKDYFWGVYSRGALVHPVQVYEFLLNYLAFFLLWRLRKHTTYPGQLFIIYIIIFSLNRAFVEFFRINPIISGWFSISHLLSMIFIGVALGFHIKLRKTRAKPSAEKNHVASKDAWIKDGLMVMGFITISLIIFYLVQG